MDAGAVQPGASARGPPGMAPEVSIFPGLTVLPPTPDAERPRWPNPARQGAGAGGCAHLPGQGPSTWTGDVSYLYLLGK